MTTRVISVSVPVADQDAARDYYTDVLGCELVTDTELGPGARLVEVRPPGSEVSICLLDPAGQIPVAVRLGTDDAGAAHDALRTAGTTLHNEEVLRWPDVPPMFAFADHDGNGLVYMEDPKD